MNAEMIFALSWLVVAVLFTVGAWLFEGAEEVHQRVQEFEDDWDG